MVIALSATNDRAFWGGIMKSITKKILSIACTLGLVSACAPTSNSPKTTNDTELNLNFSSSRIVNGESVEDADPISKSTVALYFLISTQNGTVANFCTGTLIKKNVVLTAAHCLKDASELDLKVPLETFVSRIRVGFGTQIVDSITNPKVSFLKVKNFSVHPEYISNSVKTALEKPMPDMALLQLESNAPAPYIPAALGVNPNLLQEGTLLTLAGYGYTSGVDKTDATQLMKVTVTVAEPHLSSVQFAYLVVDGKGSCSGDSGGPAYISSKAGKLTVVGVTSWGDETCVKLGAYTSVAALAGFINSSIASFQ